MLILIIFLMESYKNKLQKVSKKKGVRIRNKYSILAQNKIEIDITIQKLCMNLPYLIRYA